MIRLDRIINSMTSFQYTGGGISYLVQHRTAPGTWYIVFCDVANDIVYQKSDDWGMTWGPKVSVFTGSVSQLAVWFDAWSGLSAGLIHCAYTDSASTHDVLYRTIDTENADTLSTQTAIFAGTSAVAANGCLSITRSRGGIVYCGGMIDAGAEGFFAHLVNANVPNGAWASRTDTLNEASATDKYILLPGWAADADDAMAFFWDDSANEISRKLFDASANSWAETSIATSMTDAPMSTDGPHWAGAVDSANSRNVLIAWSARDALNADLRLWTVTESAITESATNVVLNSTDDQGFAALNIDTVNGVWNAFYGGKSDGSETMNTAVNIYRKQTTDAGATWGAETQISQNSKSLRWMATAMRSAGEPLLGFTHVDTSTFICASVPMPGVPAFGGGMVR